MAHEIVMPQLGLAMESGRIVAWVKQPGDRIKAGEVLLEVETDKATIEVEAIENGILHVLTPAGDGTVPVGATIGFVLAEGEPAPEQGREESPVQAAVSPVGASTPSAPIGVAAAAPSAGQRPRRRRAAVQRSSASTGARPNRQEHADRFGAGRPASRCCAKERAGARVVGAGDCSGAQLDHTVGATPGGLAWHRPCAGSESPSKPAHHARRS